ncbi:TIM barrel protein [Truepera radiovictrix]|uniref:Myo-inosose-2 dehydratase n=1 Tax=Truepera radiovictrix (strain DSM 17093 / CIP 108686 / LMG 22925 / RQ-24) TaxID=649638 RepID=D7CWF3_TRURR|nr:TIM barrel protein [Truepera radiovictrix]ADI14352.1 Myo-inosose-2 dehydratase [Truepera radiovictrix DSM 17093]WMT57091.1 TIM barrel protein [Truepera radiovictrix]
MSLKLGNAPCSWGTIEGLTGEDERISYTRMLDELVEAGYAGTELGDYGFLPTDPAALRRELASRGLTMLGAYVDVALADPAALAEGTARATTVARLLASVADVGDPQWTPYLILADAHSRDPQRFRHAGRLVPEMALDKAQLRTFAANAEAVARSVKRETGLKTLFHHHCAGFIETPDEIDRFLSLTDPELIGLVFDTGHYLYGTGGCHPEAVTKALERLHKRVRYVHFKDVDASVAARARREGWDYKTAVGRGVFCELGRGCVDFGHVTGRLRSLGYEGWVTVEQDVLPGLGTPRESAERNRAFLRRFGL